MGKIRSDKKYRFHNLRSPGLSLKSRLAVTSHEKPTDPVALPPPPEGKEGIVPMPLEVMQSLPVIRLSSGDGGEGVGGKRTKIRKKKERRQLKRDHWIQKIEMCKEEKEKERAAKERKKTVIVGDMEPLVTSLPRVSASLSSSKKTEKSRESRTLLSEMDHFQDVLKHPAFKQDPLGAISEHVKNSVSIGIV